MPGRPRRTLGGVALILLAGLILLATGIVGAGAVPYADAPATVSVAPGAVATVTVDGFSPGAQVTVYSVVLTAAQTVTADGSGTASIQVDAPQALGSYPVLFAGPSAQAAPQATLAPGRMLEVAVPLAVTVQLDVATPAGSTPTGVAGSGAPVAAGSGAPARTGLDVLRMLAVAAAALAVGSAAVVLGRSRRARHVAR